MPKFATGMIDDQGGGRCKFTRLSFHISFQPSHLPCIQVKYRLAESDIQAFVLTLIHKGNCVAGELALKGVAPDPGDDKIISCAIEGEAEFIVTGDKALQQLKEYQGIKIINAEQFIRVLGEKVERKTDCT
ncbi:PIN domain-containing protein [Dehalococcoidia bacterium]|nr:PIN domain-containing protein [Dehalococcoidia bacterium]